MRTGVKARFLGGLLCVCWLAATAYAPPAGARQGVTEDYAPVVAEILERGDAALDAYGQETFEATGSTFSRLYFDVFEGSGMEFTLGLKDQSFMLRIESGFSQVISLSMRGAEAPAVEAAWARLRGDLLSAVERYSNPEATESFWGTALQSFLILFREGVEAMLVVAALVAYLRRSGYADKVPVIWHGVVWALLASGLAAWLLNVVFRVSGAGRETLEGFTVLGAAALLIYVSYWLFAKREAERWQAFIRDQMDKAMSRGSLMALGFVAFLAVFREGAETILFYQALIASVSGGMNPIWVGMGLATAVLAAVYVLVRFASLRLPLGLFFSLTAVLLFGMAFTFTGKGLLELQVSGLVPTTPVGGVPQISWLGVFPTRETLLGQTLVLCLLPLGWFWLRLGRQRVTARNEA